MKQATRREALTADELFVGILPPQPTIYEEATFGVPLEKFLAAVRLVLPMVDPEGGPWRLVGYGEGELSLQKTLDPSLVGWDVDLQFGLGFSPHAVKLSFFDRDNGTLRIFTSLVAALTQILPRSA